MQKAVLAARVLMGLIFVVFGVNYFIEFLPQPEPSEAAGAFLGALIGSGYLFPFMKIVDIVAGAMLLLGIGVPLALTLLAPIVVNILLYHVFLDLAGIPVALLITALNVFLAWAYRDSFRGVLDFGAKPSV